MTQAHSPSPPSATLSAGLLALRQLLIACLVTDGGYQTGVGIAHVNGYGAVEVATVWVIS